MLDFFVSEAKKRKLLSSRAQSQLLDGNGRRSKLSQATVYGNEISIQNSLKVPKEYTFGKPFSVEKPLEPTHSELFNKHLQRLTNYEQRVKYGLGDDIKQEHEKYAQEPLEGMQSRLIPMLDQERPKPTLFPPVDPFSSRGSFRADMEKDE